MSHRSLEPTSFRRELRTTTTLAGPLVLGHLSTALIGFVDNVIAGHHGTRTLASVTIGNALYFLPLTVVMGTLMAVPPSVSELYGAGRRREIGPLFRQALWLAVGLAPPLFLFLTLIPQALPAMGIASEIAPGATAFLHGIRWGVPAFCLFLCMRYMSDGVQFTLPTMLLSFGGLLLLVPLGYALTYGAFGAPELGAGGLGFATAIVLWTQAIVLAVYLARARRFSELELFSRFDPPRVSELARLLGTGLPIGFTVLMEGSLFIVAALLIGRLGEVPAAAHQVAINVASLAFMIPLGIAEATTVRVGHAVGRGDRLGIRRAAFAGFVIMLGTQLVSGAVLLLGNHEIVRLYTKDPAVAALAASLILYAAAFQFPDGAQVLSNGALRGLRDTRMPMILAAIAYWVVGIPLGASLSLHFGQGPRGMWTGLIVGLTVAAVLLGSRFLRSSRTLPLVARPDHGS